MRLRHGHDGAIVEHASGGGGGNPGVENFADTFTFLLLVLLLLLARLLDVPVSTGAMYVIPAEVDGQVGSRAPVPRRRADIRAT